MKNENTVKVRITELSLEKIAKELYRPKSVAQLAKETGLSEASVSQYGRWLRKQGVKVPHINRSDLFKSVIEGWKKTKPDLFR